MITVAPAISEPQPLISVSCAAWASLTLAAEPAEPRQGSPTYLASCPAPSVAFTCSGVPKTGAPDFMCTLEAKAP